LARGNRMQRLVVDLTKPRNAPNIRGPHRIETPAPEVLSEILGRLRLFACYRATPFHLRNDVACEVRAANLAVGVGLLRLRAQHRPMLMALQ
jgi:hypothetical protein